MKLVRIGPAGHEVQAVSTDGHSGYLLPAGFDVRRDDHLAIARGVLEDPGDSVPVSLDDVRAATPLIPGKIVCAGLNYRRHALEAGMPVPEEPILFLKAPDTVNGPDDDVLIPAGSSKTDYEVELAVVIGRTARSLPDDADVAPYVLGYMAADDVSEREFQFERGGQWDKGKNCATFTPLGPWLVTADEVPDPQALRLRTAVNGETRQDSTTADMIFDVATLIRYVSRFMNLYPGDVLLTGTPQGVGSGFAPPRFLSAGDVVQIEVEGLGTQRHRFVAVEEREQER